MRIDDLKKKYGRIFSYKSGNIQYIYRPLTVSEYRETSIIEEMDDKERKIIGMALLSPLVSFDDLPTGVAESLINLISKVTDISQESITQKVQAERDRLGMADDFLKWKVQIIKALNYTPEQVDRMRIDEFVQALVLAEEVLQVPLVAVGKEETPTTPMRDVPSNVQPMELDNMNQMPHVADLSADHLRSVYKKTRGVRPR